MLESPVPVLPMRFEEYKDFGFISSVNLFDSAMADGE